MSTTDRDETTTDIDNADELDDRLETAARAELLERENERLRAEYARTRQSQYRRTAAGLALVGVCAAVAAALFPDGRDVLFSLAAVGLFGGVLTYYLTPGTFVAADVGERIYAAMAANQAAIAAELGLSDERVYLSPSDESGILLYVPQQASGELPAEVQGPILTDPEHRGLALEPTGASLFEEFERALTGKLATTPAPLATQLADGLVEQFELADSAQPDVDSASSRVTIAINASAFGDVDRFDHPIASFLAVGFVAGLERPVRLEVDPGDERSDWLVTCRWHGSEDEDASDTTVLTHNEGIEDDSSDESGGPEAT